MAINSLSFWALCGHKLSSVHTRADSCMTVAFDSVVISRYALRQFGLARVGELLTPHSPCFFFFFIDLTRSCLKDYFGKQVPDPLKSDRKIGILLPNNQRDHRTLHFQKDMLSYALR